MSRTPSRTACRTACRRGGVLKWILLLLVGLVVLLVAGVLLTPTLVSSMAPGQIQAAAAKSIKGSVRVKSVSVGWGSPTKVDDLELLDPEGKVVGRVSVETPATLWQVVSERWWTMKNLDAGEVKLSGVLELINDAKTGTSNLQRAIEPRTPQASGADPKTSTAGSGGAAGGPESIKAKLVIAQLDATVRDRDLAGTLSPEIGVKRLKGSADVEFKKNPMTIVSKIDLTGDPVGPAASGEPVKLMVDANIKPSGKGSGLKAFEQMKVNLRATNAPIGLIDAIASQGGALVSGVGPRADIRMDAQSDAQAAQLQFVMTSDGVQADVGLALKDGVVSATGVQGAGGSSKNTITVKSTGFIAQLPALREAMARMGQQVKLDQAPGLEIALEKLRWPVPAELVSGTGSVDWSKVDLRGAGMLVTAKVAGMSGQIALDGGGTAGGAGAASTSGNWRRFSVEPITLNITAADLAQPLNLSGGTRATIDGSPAGDVQIRGSATGLLDAAGRLRPLNKGAGLAEAIEAQISVQGLSTALVQPLIAGANVPLDLRTDIGPTLNVQIATKADVKGFDPAAGAGQVGGGGLPPIDFTMNVQSANVTMDGAGRLAAGIATTTGGGLKVNVSTLTPMLRALLSKPGQAQTVALSGEGRLVLSVQDFSAPLDKLKGADALGAVKAKVNVDIQRLGVLPLMGSVPGSAAEGAAPVQIESLVSNIVLDGASPPRLDVNGSMSHDGQAFTLTGQLALDGIVQGKMPVVDAKLGSGARVIAMKPSGQFDLRGLPRSVLNLVPATQGYGTTALAGSDMPAQINRAVRESVGRSVSLALSTKPEGAAQGATLVLTTEAGGVGGSVQAKLTAASATISSVQASLSMDPARVNSVLASAGGAGGAGGAAPQLGQPFKLTVQSTEPITLPLKVGADGATSLDLAGASNAKVALSTDADIVVNNVPSGSDSSGAARTTTLRVRGIAANIDAPLSGLAGAGQETKRLAATFKALAVGGADGQSMIADVSGNVTAGMSGQNPQADVQLKSINTAVVDGLLGKPGLLSGGLGETASATLRMQPQGATTSIVMELTAPKVSDARISMVQDASRIALTAPTVITWRPDASFMNQLLLAPKPGSAPVPAGQRVQFAAVQPITINLNKLAIAAAGKPGPGTTGQALTGPMKPGVFELDAAISMPGMSLNVPGSGAGSGDKGAASTTLALDNISGTVRQPLNDPARVIAVDLSIGRVTGAGAAGDKPSTLNARISNLADAGGVIQTQSAVLNLQANLASFPTTIIDALANQGGILTELLGPTVDVQATAQNLSAGGGDIKRASGRLEVKAGSPRAGADLIGEIRDGAFTQTGPISFRLLEIRPQLIQLLQGGVPIVESVEKSRQDDPAVMNGTTLSWPLDGDISKLSGVVTIDPGIARFQTKSILGDFIGALGGKASGELGRRLEPFTIRADRGVLTYDRFKLPVGQFNLETKGVIDLVKREIDVVTYTPLFSLTERALGGLNTGLAGRIGVLDRNTLVPITTKGSLDNPKTELDLGLFFKERGEELTKQPEKIIGNIIGDLLGPKKPEKAPPKKP